MCLLCAACVRRAVQMLELSTGSSKQRFWGAAWLGANVAAPASVPGLTSIACNCTAQWWRLQQHNGSKTGQRSAGGDKHMSGHNAYKLI